MTTMKQNLNEKASKKDLSIAEDKIKDPTEFFIDQEFTPQQMENLSYGHRPQGLNDKWFFYMEDNKLYVHRGYTETCLYIVEFGPDGKHKVLADKAYIYKAFGAMFCTYNNGKGTDFDEKVFLKYLLNKWANAET